MKRALGCLGVRPPGGRQLGQFADRLHERRMDKVSEQKTDRLGEQKMDKASEQKTGKIRERQHLGGAVIETERGVKEPGRESVGAGGRLASAEFGRNRFEGVSRNLPWGMNWPDFRLLWRISAGRFRGLQKRLRGFSEAALDGFRRPPEDAPKSCPEGALGEPSLCPNGLILPV